MSSTILVIVLLQGIFLLIILFKRKEAHQPLAYKWLSASIVALMLFVIGEKDRMILGSMVDFFMLDSSLFITCFFLFIRYIDKEKASFNPKDFLFFIPYLIYLVIESFENSFPNEAVLEAAELIVELSFITYLIIILRLAIDKGKKKWVLFLSVPMMIMLSFSLLNDALQLLGISDILDPIDDRLDGFAGIIVAILFYFIAYKLVSDPQAILPVESPTKYAKSTLDKEKRMAIKTAILTQLEQKEIFRTPKITVDEFADRTGYPRQYISEVIHSELNSNFMDLVNGYRIAAFEISLKEDRYKQYTLMGIAEECGFSSKSTFNAVFKQAKGLTPSEYKSRLIEE
jgi:AraC-like DNA-binding protein